MTATQENIVTQVSDLSSVHLFTNFPATSIFTRLILLRFSVHLYVNCLSWRHGVTGVFEFWGFQWVRWEPQSGNSKVWSWGLLVQHCEWRKHSMVAGWSSERLILYCWYLTLALLALQGGFRTIKSLFRLKNGRLFVARGDVIRADDETVDQRHVYKDTKREFNSLHAQPSTTANPNRRWRDVFRSTRGCTAHPTRGSGNFRQLCSSQHRLQIL